MSKNIKQVYDTNPAVAFNATDLIYLGQSPYGAGDDAACLYSTLSAQFAPAAGSTSITTLGTVTTGTWNADIIGAAYGGTGVNNGANTMTLGGLVSTDGSFTMSGAFPFTGTLTGITAVTFPTSGTLATTAQIPADPLPLANGGTNANLTANIGGIFYSTATEGAILAGNATAGKVLQSGASAAPIWSTPTYPSASGTAGLILRSDGTNNVYTQATFADLYAASSILYSNGANNVAGLATANNAVLVTGGTGIPSLSSTLPSFTTNTITFNPTTAGILGTTTNDDAAAGYVGEFISSNIVSGSAVSLTTGMITNVTNISLTAGDWDVYGLGATVAGAGTITTNFIVGISLTSATFDAISPNRARHQIVDGNFSANANLAFPTGNCRINVGSTTTVYLVVRGDFSVSTLGAYGYIAARRVR